MHYSLLYRILEHNTELSLSLSVPCTELVSQSYGLFQEDRQLEVSYGKYIVDVTSKRGGLLLLIPLLILVPKCIAEESKNILNDNCHDDLVQ